MSSNRNNKKTNDNQPELCYPLVVSNNSISQTIPANNTHNDASFQPPFPTQLPVRRSTNRRRSSGAGTSTIGRLLNCPPRHRSSSIICSCNGPCRKICWCTLPFIIIIIVIVCLFVNYYDTSDTESYQSGADYWNPWNPFHISRALWSKVHTKFSNQTYLDSNGTPFPWQQIRLPRAVRPVQYDLFMWPDMVSFNNTGNVSILFDLHSNVSTNYFVLHSKSLAINRVRLFHKVSPTGNQTSRETPVVIVKYITSPKLEQLYIETNQTLRWPHRYRLSIEYSHKLSQDLEGFYVSSYMNNRTKTKHHLLTTHFEPTAARSAFPCFDEPALKARFGLRIRHDSNYQAFFNSPILDRESLAGSEQVVSAFEYTVPMSTYLVAFVVCDFAVNKTTDSTGLIEIRTLVPEDQSAHTRYALEFASKALDFYHNFFRVSYPLPKLDMVAVPDFGAGAMENWGIITFRTTSLIFNEKESSAEMKEMVGTVIAHELAHQWFGNLVTMNWWDELWLNEGFASYVENLGVDSVHPEWRMLDQFVISTSQPALALDALLTSHPIYATVKNPTEIEALFDMISYKKGSCLIRMIEQFMGKQALQLGLQRYLEHYMYSTATTLQLWAKLSDLSKSLNVSRIMDTWIHQAGFPVLTVRWNDKNDGLIIRQSRFVSSLGPEETDSKLLWNVPVTILRSGGRTEPTIHWLMGVEQIEVPLNRTETVWYKLNYEQAAFYRVNYDQSNWRELIQRVSYTQSDAHFLSAVDRAGLLDDAFALLRNGHLDVNTALDLTRYLEYGEMDYVPWETALNHFGLIDTIMNRNELLQRYVVRLIRSIVQRLGWQELSGDSLFEIKLRAIILRASIFYGNERSVKRAKEMFNSWMLNGTKIAANIRETVYHAGIQYGGEKEYSFVWSKFKNETDASEKRILLSALSSIRQLDLLESYLNSSLNQTLIRSQDFPFVVQCSARNPIGRNLTWNFVRNNWKKIYKTFGQGSFSLDVIIAESIWHFSTETEYQEVRQFFDGVEVGSGQQSLKQSLEKIRANILWKKNVQSKVIAWLNKTQSLL